MLCVPKLSALSKFVNQNVNRGWSIAAKVAWAKPSERYSGVLLMRPAVTTRRNVGVTTELFHGKMPGESPDSTLEHFGFE